MFSLNSINTQNQVLVSLNQLSSRYASLFKQRKQRGEKTNHVKRKEASYDATICQESLSECLRNFEKDVLKEMRQVDLRAVTLSRARPSGLTSAKKVSFISEDSFEKNKNGWSSTPTVTVDVRRGHFNVTENFVGLLASSLRQNSFKFNVQVRGFKTERGVDADLKRNPNLINRLRKSLGLNLVDNPSNKPGSGPEVAPRLDKLLSEDSPLTHEQKDKIKIAFAEGYLAGSHPDNARGTKASKYLKVVQQLLTIVLFLAIFVSLMASVSGTVFSRIQLGNQVEVDPEDISVTFDDVKGADEAKQELKDVVEFLKSPEKFSSLGGKLPKGVLLVGPPGTGKTLLARAVAGEARVPFFHAAGPEFDEILVGQGARRVRDLFKAAKERAPCVIFIDEIDSVGAKRTNSVLHPYANQTINQLLSEMDGFHQNEGVIVLGATNRREDLDQALLRPGRFDVEVNVPTPDYEGRLEILQMYLSRVAASPEVQPAVLARGTTGFTGADLENMVNQAALKAAIDGAKTVTMKYLEHARDKVLMGPERRARLPDEEANAITAYHEAGHAAVAYYTKDSHPLHKVTIMPRGSSLGHTAYIPSKERYHVTKQQLLAMMDSMMGGRAAEELVFGPDKITSGASSDLTQATSIAQQMVSVWGMSDAVGLRTHPPAAAPPAPATTELMDKEIKKILSESYERAKAILRAHAKEHRALAEALLKYETLDADDIKAIMSGSTIRPDKVGKEPVRESKDSKEPSPPGLMPHPAPA
ncbi:ATP-dependent zinc metalloprotease YME1L isoform X2 [Plutella xylostella]|uniref:ATP-dependent zinc metalloprotease YME1L isoform X1 n=1 Tax=Plutella xylostella TaxID=51655 RepID=UPI002032345E|nr:ATP-dependent zinc metalloprotease YME1L isoform X1 [Plutella xylostella]XP_048487082.1 ATP-dependent zinc metalloprotease YME1L isoform X2 [Plutella xylostella]